MQQHNTSMARSLGCVLVSGGTGFVGRHLIRELLASGSEVLVYTRSAQKCRTLLGSQVRAVVDLAELHAGTRIDAMVNLAGLPIMGFPWTPQRRRQLLQSRLTVTRALIEVARRISSPPATLVSASAIGYYGVRGDEPVDERDAPTQDFQSLLCQQWEQAALQAESAGTRVTCLRLGVVLGRGGGALPQLLRPARLGLGAILGSGRQWVSWIHIDDAVGLARVALAEPAARGALNATAPHPVTQEQLQRALAAKLHRPLWLRLPARALRLALGELAQLLVDGQRVLPVRALELGYRFRYPDITAALEQLVHPDPAHTSRRNSGTAPRDPPGN